MNAKELFNAVDNDNAERIKRYIQEGINVDSINRDKYTPLLCAIYDGNNDLVKLLVELGADVNGNRETCCYPLEMSCLSGNIDSIYVLDQTGKLKYNRTSDCSLIYASSKGFTKIVEHLLKKGIDVNMNGIDAIHMAAQEGYLNVVKLLLQYGTDVNQLNNEGMTALYVAAAENHLEIVDLLLGHHANVDYGEDASPFMIACAYDNMKVAKVLLMAGANIDYIDKDGRTSLFFAKIKRDKKMQEFLLSHGASTNIVDNAGISIKDLDNEKIRKKLYRELF